MHEKLLESLLCVLCKSCCQYNFYILEQISKRSTKHASLPCDTFETKRSQF